MLEFDKVAYLSLFFKHILIERLRFIILLCTLLVISFAQFKEYMIWCISFSKFLDVLPAFTGARDIGNL